MRTKAKALGIAAGALLLIDAIVRDVRNRRERSVER